MAAYVIVDSEITDQAVFDGYIRDIPAVVEKNGGNYLVRGGPTEVVSGNWTVVKMVDNSHMAMVNHS